MRLSSYFLPILRESPKEAEIVSHRYMLRAGLVRQTSSGIYAWLPLGLRVLKKIETIVREEQNRAGAVEMLMPTIQSADLWRKSGRYQDYGKEMLRLRDRHERDMLYGPTNEEMITDLFCAGLRSYRELPRMLYHIQWKFRDEIRPRFGVMRGREFLMKDAYSFDISAAAGALSYRRMFASYLRTFARMNLQAIPVAAETGPIGGDLSHEFLILAQTGESDIHFDKTLLDFSLPDADWHKQPDLNNALNTLFNHWTTPYAATGSMHNQDRFVASTPESHRISARAIEVGHIFFFGDKYSVPLDAVVHNRDGEPIPLQSGSYGIGISRLVGAIIEAYHDDSGIIWPEAVAPFRVGLLNLKSGTGDVDLVCEDLYAKLTEIGYDVLYDDSDERPGAKFAVHDLLGLPWRIIVGPQGVAKGEVEIARRDGSETHTLTPEALLNMMAARV